MRRRAKRPPLRRCGECGGDFYAWSGLYCGACAKGKGDLAALRADPFRPRNPLPDDHSASRRVEVLEQEAPHLFGDEAA